MFDKPHFQVKLHSDLLQVDLKEGARRELERLAEARPVLRESLGWIFQTIIPLDVKLHDIENVEVDHDGKVKVIIPGRRDIHIPLEHSESQRLVEKLNELIPVEKEKQFRERQLSAARKAEMDRQTAQGLVYTRESPR